MSDPHPGFHLEAVLRAVDKPGRYVGGEWNSIRKDPGVAVLKVGLAFPDVYEVGMSYLGQKILYDVINARPEYLAERVFAPWPDFEAGLRKAALPLFTLENRIPIRALDALGFSLLYELNNTNILTILDLGGIPRRSAARDAGVPLVIGGGPAAFNPEPLAEFFDLFLVGDGEEAVLEILDRMAALKSPPVSRDRLLRELAGVAGVYVPSLYETVRAPGSRLLSVRPRGEGVPPVVRKRVLRSFAQSAFPADIVVPTLKAVFDRVAVEAARGCPHKCRFCQAASVYAPFRVKDPGFVVAKVFESCRSTGYEDASLFSLSVGDYPYLGPTIKTLMAGLERERISLSLSSLRPKALSADIIRNIVKVRKTGFTLVPEAGTERLRGVINKSFGESDLIEAAAGAFREGWRLLKLYFMIGLPTETDADIAGIAALVRRITALGRGILGSPPRIHVSVSSFIPKPHTPFQWARMEGRETLTETQKRLRRELRPMRNVEIKDHPVESSVLEAAFSRGDRRLAAVLEKAWERGCRFDGWQDHFKPELWSRSFEDAGVAPDDYLARIPLEARLPWDHIATGVRRSFLEDEYRRSEAGERSPSCLETSCGRCRGCDFAADLERSFEGRIDVESRAFAVIGSPAESARRYLAVFGKFGPARFISHNDLVNLLKRIFRRAGMPVEFSAGFHPKMLMSFAPALPLGMTASREPFEFRSAVDIDANAFLEAMNRKAPSGLEFRDLLRLGPGAPRFAASIRAMTYSLDLADVRIREALADVRHRRGWRGGDAETADRLAGEVGPKLSPLVEEFRVDTEDGKAVMRIRWDHQQPVRPQDVVREALGVADAVFALCRESIDLGELTAGSRIGIN
jgi:radical SAM family uncharacterized protein/radical SAM-linked protein